MVMSSWLTFYFDMDKIGERVGLVLTTLLAMCAITNTTMEKTPTMNYIKAIEIYMIVCTLFIFSSLVQTAIICFSHGKMKRSTTQEQLKLQNLRKINVLKSNESKKNCVENIQLSSTGRTSFQKADIYSRSIIPCLFVIFNFTFWMYFAVYSTNHVQANDWISFKYSE